MKFNNRGATDYCCRPLNHKTMLCTQGMVIIKYIENLSVSHTT